MFTNYKAHLVQRHLVIVIKLSAFKIEFIGIDQIFIESIGEENDLSLLFNAGIPSIRYIGRVVSIYGGIRMELDCVMRTSKQQKNK